MFLKIEIHAKYTDNVTLTFLSQTVFELSLYFKMGLFWTFFKTLAVDTRLNISKTSYNGYEDGISFSIT